MKSLKQQISEAGKVKTPRRWGLSSGCTLLNLALTGRVSYGFQQGCCYLFVGDSAAGKTFLGWQTLAEAVKNPHFDDYDLVFDDAESGTLMDLEKFFGKKLTSRVMAPHGERHSVILEEFYYGMEDRFDAGKPFIYVLDSMDALRPKAEIEKSRKKKMAFQKGGKEVGSYGMDKAKINAASLRIVHNRCNETGSMAFLIAQTRDNIGFDAMFNPKTRGGGTAMKFYAEGEMWFSIKGKIKRYVLGKDRKSGSILRVRIKKNRHTGYEPTVDLHHYPSTGFDDVGSCVAWLVEEGHWKKSKGGILASELSLQGSHEDLVEQIEKGNQEKNLKQIVADVWSDIMEGLAVNRKRRYL